MIRRWTIGVLAAVAVLALAVPAHAKGEAAKVSISNGGGGTGGGPGGGSASGGSGSSDGAALLASPIVLTGVEASAWLGDSGVFQDRWARSGSSSLGPGLDVTVAYECGSLSGTLAQRLFPYAAGGPMVRTPSQAFCDSGRIGAGWWPLAANSLRLLQDHGLPAEPPAAPAGAATGASHPAAKSEGAVRPAPAGDSGTAALPIALGVTAILVLVAGNVVAYRRGRTPAAA
jgi:hypothetical protein